MTHISEQSNPNGCIPVYMGKSGEAIDTATVTALGTTLLAPAGVFTGPWVDVTAYAQISVFVYVDQPSAAGGFEFQFSDDGINVRHTHVYDALANVGEMVKTDKHTKYYRIVYTNGAVAQGVFIIQPFLRPISSQGTVLELDDVPSAHDDAVLTKTQLMGENVLLPGDYLNVKSTPDGGLLINQFIQIDPANGSTTNLAAGATFTGGTTSNITASMIQVFLNTDQNCDVFVDQSQDGINFDISDRFDFLTSEHNFGINVGAFGAYFRVRVTNKGQSPTTYFRLQTIYVPIANQLPRALDERGKLQVGVKSLKDESGFSVANTMHGEQLTAITYRLAGSGFSHPSLDTLIWTPSVGTGGTVAISSGELLLSTGTTANNAVSVQTIARARQIAGTSNKMHCSVRFPDSGLSANNTRRWGFYDVNNGAFFQIVNGAFSIVTRKGGVDTTIANGSFNGQLGSTVVITNTNTEFNIMYALDGIYCYLGETLLHFDKFPAAMWTNDIHAPFTIENFNTGGNTTDIPMYVRHAVIMRLGQAFTAGRSDFSQRAGTDITKLLKVGPGNLHNIILSGITNNSVVTFYDNISAAAPLLWTSGPLTPNGLPFSIDFQNAPFYTGLYLTITSANCNVFTDFE